MRMFRQKATKSEGIAHLLIVFVPCEVVTNFMSLVAAIQKLTVRFFGLLVGRAMMLKF